MQLYRQYHRAATVPDKPVHVRHTRSVPAVEAGPRSSSSVEFIVRVYPMKGCLLLRFEISKIKQNNGAGADCVVFVVCINNKMLWLEVLFVIVL